MKFQNRFFGLRAMRFLTYAMVVSAFVCLAGCDDSGSGKVIIQNGSRTVTYDRDEFDRLVAAGEIDPHTGLPIEKDKGAYPEPDQEEKTEEISNEEPSAVKDPAKQDASDQGGKAASKASAEKLDITPSEASSVKYVTVSDTDGYFSCEVPKGWQVSIGLKPDGTFDLISYAITVYDPKNPDRQLYYALSTACLKSEEAREWYKAYEPSPEITRMAVMTDPDTEGFFKGMEGYYGYKNFSLKENLGRGALGGDILVADSVSSSTGKNLRGLFGANVLGDMPYIVKKNPTSFVAGDMIDVGTWLVYTIFMETAPEEEFIDWQPVLDHCLASIRFTQKFMKERSDLWKVLVGTGQYIMYTSDQISDMIMDSYEKRNKTYDVESQKYSDATMGYERVRDTETGDYYKAEIGFSDWYDGKRYEPDDSDNAYLSPVEGYINWK